MPRDGLGFRRFLGLTEPADPPRLTELAELGEEGVPAKRSAQIAEGVPASLSPAATDANPVPEILAKTKNKPDVTTRRARREPLDPRSWAAEKLSRSNSIAGLMHRKF